MIDVTTYQGRKVAVFGLGRTGIAAITALKAGGADVLAWDDGEQARAAALQAGAEIVELHADVLKDVAALVLSPGVPLTHPEPHKVVKAAQQSGCPVIGDVELFGQMIGPTHTPMIAITGTNGKSTTTALAGHVLKAAGKRTQVGGNIGDAVLGLDSSADAYVLELSSYQIDLCQTFAADIAVLLNIGIDHIDRHGSLEGYIAAKARLFEMQQAGGVAIISVDDPHSARLCAELAGEGRLRVVPISIKGSVAHGVFVQDGWLMDAMEGEPQRVFELARATRLPGIHNGQNMAAVYAIARLQGVGREVIARAFESFAGLAHRIELIGERDGVRFVNDSKATNADAAQHALRAFEQIHWIVGGVAKEDGIAPLADLFPRVVHAYLIGEASQRFEEEIAGAIPVTQCGDLETATRAAARAAAQASGGVVLLSPACASFDQYKNFELRGDAFRAVVQSILAEAAA